MIALLIGCHAQSHVLAFGNDREGAERELAALQAVMGRDRWGSNGKENNPTHTFKCPTGDVTVVLEKVEVVRLVDKNVEAEILAEAQAKQDERDMSRELRWRGALADAGFAKRVSADQPAAESCAGERR